MRFWPEIIAAAVMTACMAGAAQAQTLSSYRLDPSAPLNIGADESSYDPDTCTTTLRGRAEVTQDRTRLRARTVKTVQAKGRSRCGDISRVDATGDVYYVTPMQTIKADNAIYDLAKDLATFTGNVIAVQGKDVTASDRLVVNISSGAVQMNGRVRAVIYPSQSSGPTP